LAWAPENFQRVAQLAPEILKISYAKSVAEGVIDVSYKTGRLLVKELQ
jgi:hypothetical protein